jgi:hypothetical protein
VQVDKVYLNTPTKIAIIDHELKRTFVIQKDGFPDAGRNSCKRDNLSLLYVYIA